MIEFLRKKKVVEIDGIEFEIKRREISLLFLLIENISNIEKLGKEYFEFVSKKTKFVDKSFKEYFKLVDKILNYFYTVKIRDFKSLLFCFKLKKLSIGAKLFLIREILDFNMGVSKQRFSETTRSSEKEILNGFYYLITQVIFYTGWTLDYVLSLDYNSLYIIYNNIRYYRFNNAIDMAGGYDLKSFKRVLQI